MVRPNPVRTTSSCCQHRYRKRFRKVNVTSLVHQKTVQLWEVDLADGGSWHPTMRDKYGCYDHYVTITGCLYKELP